MKIILGLGNPGAEYENTRHNAGVLFVDKLFSNQSSVISNQYGWRKNKGVFVAKFPDLVLIKTKDYFMNESGNIITSPSVPLLISGEGSNFYLAHDDLDIKLGEFKIQKGVGPKLHNGVDSVENALKTKDFWRIRIGVDNRPHSADGYVRGEEYVLQKFTLEERKVLDETFEKISTFLSTSPSV